MRIPFQVRCFLLPHHNQKRARAMRMARHREKPKHRYRFRKVIGYAGTVSTRTGEAARVQKHDLLASEIMRLTVPFFRVYAELTQG